MNFRLSDLRPRTITQKILASLLFISSIITLLITFLQLYFDYTQEINALKKSLTLVEQSYSKSVASSLWELNDAQVKTQLDGIISIPGIKHALITYRGKVLFEAGVHADDHFEKSIELIHREQQEDVDLGVLVLHGSKEEAIDKIKNKIFIIFISQFVKTFLVSAFLFLSIQHLITKHLIQISSFVKNIDIKSREKLTLDRKNPIFNNEDELDSLVISINKMRDNLSASYAELEDMNSEQRRQLEFSARMSSLGEMAGGIAHEINNPLTIIGTSSKLLKKNIDQGVTSSEKISSYFEKIDKTTERITKIINGMLAISRDSTNENFSLFTWNDVIQDVLALCGEKFKHAGIEIRIPETQSLHKSYKGRKVQLSQVLLNLLHNSYDAIIELPERWIEISCQSVKGEMVIKITDSGKGIPAELHDKIMQPFFTTKEVGKGTGLGLSLSMSIIQKHNGQFFIDKNSAHTSFIIKLPDNV